MDAELGPVANSIGSHPLPTIPDASPTEALATDPVYEGRATHA